MKGYSVTDRASPLEHHTCVECGTEWTRSPTKGHRPRYCPTCRTSETKVRVTVPCSVCGSPCQRKPWQPRLYRTTCSTACRTFTQSGASKPTRREWEAARRRDAWTDQVREWDKAKAARRALTPVRPSFVSGTCVMCGASFTALWHTTRPYRYCSSVCSKKAHRDKRRAAQRGAYIEPVSWRLLVATHGYACYLCGEDTNPNDHTTMTGSDGRTAFVAGPSFPTVDHVLALANGGAHSRANAQVAHLLCNSIKGTD
jgi:hypothetical protein